VYLRAVAQWIRHARTIDELLTVHEHRDVAAECALLVEHIAAHRRVHRHVRLECLAHGRTAYGFGRAVDMTLQRLGELHSGQRPNRSRVWQALAVERDGGESPSDAAGREAIELALDAGRMGVFSWDAVNDVVVWDHRIETLFGVPSGSFGGRYADWVASVHPDDRERATAIVEHAMRTGAAFDFEHRVIHPDGSVRWLEGRGRAILAGGRVVGVRGVTVDITHRKRVELELAAAQRRIGVLARAGEALGATLDVDTALSRLADAIVPGVADAFEVALLAPNGELERRVVVGPDAQWARRRLAAPVPLVAGHPFARAVRGAEVVHVRAAEQPDQFGPPDEPATAAAAGLCEGIVLPLFDRPGSALRRVVGVLSVGLVAGSRSFDRDDLDFFVDLASRVSVAIERGRSYERERVVAERLQHALLPDAVPTISGLDIAVRYRASGAGVQIGGDWYDVVESPDGVWISVGDVVGRGVEAAAFMGRARAMLRALVVDESRPERALSRLDAAVAVMPDDPFVTAVLAHLRPDAGTLALALAGHPPIAVVEPGGEVVFAGRPQPPIGTYGDHQYRGEQRQLTPGSLLVFFTDGLVERRTETIDDGFGRLAAALEGWSGEGEVEAVADTLLDRLHAREARDDLALVVVRIPPLI
jgi:PAS domain S-box-containing protein